MSLIEGKEYQEQAVNGTDICGPDEYIDADGLRVCAICHKPRQIRVRRRSEAGKRLSD